MSAILIVDDKEENLYLLEVNLGLNGFRTSRARNGLEALEVLRKEHFDLIIADILMPVMDGFTLCRECKMDEGLKDIPFFFYTATYTDARDEEYALGLGADRFILKPQEPDVFLKLINDFLEDVQNSHFKSKEIIPVSDTVVLKEYNEVLVRKIEDKMQQTEKAEKELRKYASLLENEISEHLKSEERFRSTLDNMIEGCQIIGYDWRYLYVNKAAEKHYRRSKEELLGKMVTEVWPDLESTSLFDIEKQCMKERSVHHIESEFVFLDGTSGYFEFSIQPVPEGIFILSMDISLRKMAEERNKHLITSLENLTISVKELTSARDLSAIFQIIKKSIGTLMKADGSAFILREGDQCFYAEEEAIEPLWKGQRFPMDSCVSGWAMINKQPVIIEDIYNDARVPIDLYKSTFIRSLLMIPVNTLEPIGAIGIYWAEKHQVSFQGY
ncbi:MAG: response regulator [Bacteroidetes bacterium]|nr:response regulator [Bacteroidota bacterium]